MKKAIFNWSGGKDSALALHKMLQSGEYEISSLLTSVNQNFQRISMHGVRLSLLYKQVESIGIPLKELLLPEMPSMEQYDAMMQDTLQDFKNQGIGYAVFGDIFLEDLRRYREEKLNSVGIEAVFPLWKIPSKSIIEDFIDSGFQAVVVCVNEKFLDKSFAGRLLDRDFIKDLPKGVDICGENGEYHSFVFDAPFFKTKIDFQIGETVYRNYGRVSEKAEDNCGVDEPKGYDTGFWFCDLL